jgi:multidrug efflux pump subunit AcrA (membrane-fusion protein)
MYKFLKIIPLLMLIACSKGRDNPEIPVAEVLKGTFIEELNEEGTVHAVNATAISSPRISFRYGSVKIASIVEDGKEVKEGDTLIVFSPAEIKKAIVDAEQQLEIAKAEYEKLKATQESEIEDLEADLEVTKINQEISQINLDNSQYESEVTKKEIQLQLETANISLDRAKDQIENKKKIHKEELRQKMLNISQLQKTLNEANESLNSLFLISPSDGIASVMTNWMTGKKWQAGDQPYSTSPIINLPDLSEMKCEIMINEVDVAKVKPGLQVTIQADAFSDTTYSGKITSVANLAQPKDRNGKIKVFPIDVLIDGDKTNLLPGLTVSCKIMVKEIPDVIYVPVESVFEEFGISYVYLQASSGFKRKDIKTEEQNNDFIVVSEGLKAGDMVALSDPFINKQEEEK